MSRLRSCWRACLTSAVVVVVGTVASPLRADDLTLAEVFAKTARFQGDAYRVGRDLLERQGKKIIPYLREQAKSKDWQERDLARALLLHIEQPALAAACQRLQSWHDRKVWQFHKVILRDDGKVAIQWHTENGSDKQPEPEVLLDKQALPLIVEMLRETADEAYRWSGRHVAWDRALMILGHFADAESAPALVHWYKKVWRNSDEIPDILVKIGPPALPWLREAVREGGYWAGPGAIRTLARIGDPEGAPLLLEKLKAKADRLTEPCAAALAHMKVREAIPLIWEQMESVVIATRNERQGSYMPTYSGLRKALLAFGKDARAFLKEKSQEKMPLGSRVLAGGMLYELAHAKEAAAFYQRHDEAAKDEHSRPSAGFWEAPRGRFRWYGHDSDALGVDGAPPPAFVLERAHVYGQVCDLQELSRHKELPLAFEVVADAVAELRFAQNYPAALKTLAKFRDERAVAVLQKFLKEPVNYYVIAALPETLLELGSPKGAAILEEILRRADKEDPKYKTPHSYRGVADLARAVLPALQGDPRHVAKLLEHESDSVRETAALYLAARDDLRALPVLVRQAAGDMPKEVLGFQAMPTVSAQHVALREAIVHFGKAAIPALEKIQKNTESWRLRLLCESCILRIRDPKLAATFQKAAVDANMVVSMAMIPNYHRGAAVVVDAVGKKGVPLIEAALAFQTDFFGASAAYALGTLKEDRSIPVIIQSIPYLHSYSHRDEKVGASALHMFGDKGIEAAKKIPPPDPKKAHFDERAGRHRGVTEALAIEKEIKGVDNILDGLKLPRPAKDGPEFAAWLQRRQIYVRIAQKYNDKRLLEPLLQVMELKNKDLDLTALQALKPYKDPRVVERALPYLGKTHDRRYYHDPVVTVLVHQLGQEFGPFMVKQFREADGEAARVEAAHALGDFVRHSQAQWPYPPAKQDGEEDRKKADQERGQALRKLVDAAREPLRLALDDESEAVSTAAALNLVIVDYHRDAAVIKSVAAWLVKQSQAPTAVIQYLQRSRDPLVETTLLEIYPRPWIGSPWNLRESVVHYLAASKDPKMPAALLKLYRMGHGADAQEAVKPAKKGKEPVALGGPGSDSYLAWAMGELKITDAVADLADAVGRDPAKHRSRGRIPELTALCRLGDAGRAKVLNFFRAGELDLKVEAARELYWSAPPADFFSEVAPVYNKVIANPPPEKSDNQRHYQYRHRLETLTEVIVGLDKKKGYLNLCRNLFRSSDEHTRHALATRIVQMETSTAELRALSLNLTRE